uniref:Uncharacterized protein n=1 Tax=Anguilla anguilla TaxID=7936 RepID=A0A0E9S6Q4_ANGAN
MGKFKISSARKKYFTSQDYATIWG